MAPPQEGVGRTEADRPAEHGEENDRPTVSPPFDPAERARELLKPSGSMAAVTGEDGDRPTPDPAVQTATTARPRRKTPTSTLSLANARIPSNLPPREKPKAHESLTEMNPVDQEWAELELATRPPPGIPAEPPAFSLSPPKPSPLDLDDILGMEEHGADTVRRPVDEQLRQNADAVTPAAPAAAPKPAAREMNDRVELGDYSGALEIAEEILREQPGDVGAKAVAETCRTVLRQMYATRIGPLDRVPIVMVPRDQLRWLSIDHKAGFVLSLVDGVSSLEMIIDVSGMPELDTLRILSELAQQRVISLR